MKDIITKLTFGFLMAQFVPGIITICSLTFLYSAFIAPNPSSITTICNATVNLWSNSLASKLAFLGLSTASGMAIHGLHWGVIGCLEAKYGSLADSYWHNCRILFHILFGPIKEILEIGEFLLYKGGIEELAVDENVTNIKQEKMEAFHFLQDFYLHFSQFYTHTSYALIVSFLCLLPFVIVFGSTWNRILLLLLIYTISGFFFVIGRIQLTSLFTAENELEKDSESS